MFACLKTVESADHQAYLACILQKNGARMDDNLWRDLRDRLEIFVIQFLSSLIDSIFLVLWAGLQWLVHDLMKRFHLAGIESWVLVALQVAFAVATFIPVAIFVYVDIIKMFRRARNRLR